MTECVHIRETCVQAPHVTFVTFLATYDLSTGSPISKTTKRNGIRENPKEKPKTCVREQNPDSNFFLRVGGMGTTKWLRRQSLEQTVAHCSAKL